jgi:hypothetical protein
MKNRKPDRRKKFQSSLGILLMLVMIFCQTSNIILAADMTDPSESGINTDTEIRTEDIAEEFSEPEISYDLELASEFDESAAEEEVAVVSEEGDVEESDDFLSEAALAAEEPEYCTSVDEAGLMVRELMKNRVETFTIYYSGDVDEDGIQQLVNDIFEVAVQHTGNPTEGDYLEFQYGAIDPDGEFQVFYYNDGHYEWTIPLKVSYYTTMDQETLVDKKVDTILQDLKIHETADTYEKIEKIYRYVCDNVTYDYKNLDDESYHLKKTAYAALYNGTAVCQGYTNLIYRLLLEAGIDNRIITGVGYNSGTGKYEAHSWNIVKLGDVYYNLDATWDSSNYAAHKEYYYFLESNANFADHFRDDEYTSDSFVSAYPMSESNYNDSILGHDYQPEVKEPTCTTKGYTLYTCTRCGDYYYDDIKDWLGHDIQPSDIIQEPTCTEKGTANGYCSRCDVYGGVELDALGHTYEKTVTEPTCTKGGYTTYTCIRGDHSYTEDKTEPLKHNYETKVTEPTCTKGGYTTYTCTRGDDSYKGNVTNALGHTYVNNICIRCGAVETLQQPAISSVANSAKGITIKWGKVNGAVNYRVYRKTGSGAWQALKDTTAVSFEDTTAKSGTTYSYTVRCITSDGKKATSTYNTTGKSILCLANSAVTLTNASTGITLKWSKITGARGYYVYRKASGGSYTRIKTITSGSTVTYTDTAVKNQNGTTYTYFVRAYYGSTLSTYTAKSVLRLTAPTLSSVTNSASKTMTVKWAKNTRATGYQIQYKTGTTAKTVTIRSAATLSTVIKNLTKGKTYSVYIRSYRTVSGVTYYSAWSSAKNVKISK